MTRRMIAVFALVLVFALPGTAFAQTASEGYSQTPGTRSIGSAGGGSLPFTGLEVGALATLGAGLIGAGVVLHVARRREREQV